MSQITVPPQTPDTTISDDALLAGLRLNDANALQILYDRHALNVRKLALKLLRQDDGADDVVQDVFLALWQARDNWQAGGAARLSTWLYKVCVFKCADKKRQNLPSYAHDISDFQDILPSEEETALTLSRELRGLLSALPANQQLAMRLHYEADMDIDQIALRLNASELAVRSLLKRAKASLRGRMAGELHDYLS